MTVDGGSSLWIISIVLGFVSSFGTGLSKLAIRKSWIMVEDLDDTSERQRKMSSNDYDLNGENEEYLQSSSNAQEEGDTIRQAQKADIQRRALTIRTYALLQMTVINPVLGECQ